MALLKRQRVWFPTEHCHYKWCLYPFLSLKGRRISVLLQNNLASMVNLCRFINEGIMTIYNSSLIVISWMYDNELTDSSFVTAQAHR